MKWNKIILLLAMSLILIGSALAAGEITQDADKLNYWTASSHVVTVENTGTLTTNVSIDSPWSVVTTDGTYCVNATDYIECILDAGESGTYTVTSDASVGEYATQAFTLTANNSYTSETVTFVRMKDEEILRTLVEFGRGRGNYFYDSGTNRKGEQCTDLPALTDIELNYLHKVFPTINTYLNLPAADGTSVELYCEYANKTLTKTHLATNIAVGTRTAVNYSSDWIKDSWEKVFYAVQDFDSTEQAVGSQIEVNCSSLKYYLSEANGWISVSADSFALNFQNASPLVSYATASPSSIGTGTSEVAITYTITNTEDITLSSSTNPITVDIQAPQQAVFIGTRGELWGTELDTYRFELNSIGANEEVNITLYAKFETDGTTPLYLSQGISVSFVPCWQINAYNPLAIEEAVDFVGTITVTATVVDIRGIVDHLDDIEENLTTVINKLDELIIIGGDINSTVNEITIIATDINATVNSYSAYLVEINQTTHDTYDLVEAVQITVGDINVTVNENNEVILQVNGTTTSIYNNTQDIFSYITNEVYNRLVELNLTTQETNVIVKEINTSNNEMTIIVTDANSTVNDIEIIVTDINGTTNDMNIIVNDINTTVNGLDTYLIDINLTVDTIEDISRYINETRWDNWTAQEIVDAIQPQDWTSRFDAIDANLTEIDTNLRQLEEFEEESIYLITDSITEGQTAYREALQAVAAGDEELALQKLQESVDKLTTAQNFIGEIQDGKTLTQEEKQSWVSAVLNWMLAIFK